MEDLASKGMYEYDIYHLDDIEERQNVDMRLLLSSLKIKCVELVVLVLYYRHAIIADIIGMLSSQT